MPPTPSLSPLTDALYRITHPFFVTRTDGRTTVTLIHPDNAATHSNERVGGAPGMPPIDAVDAFVPAVPMAGLGDPVFLTRHGITRPCVAGAMANGISSVEMVAAMAENGMMGFFGAGGLSLEQIREAVDALTTRLPDTPFGFNLIHSLTDPALEMATVQLYLDHGIQRISAAAFMRITPALAYYRIKGIHRAGDGTIMIPNQVIGKVSRIEVARQFFSPPPKKLVDRLLAEGLITATEATLSQSIPMAHDVTAEADSGGHTDNQPALTLLPTMVSLKHQLMDQYRYPDPLCVGLGGGIATPESAAAAFGMGAAFVLTGSINQSCVEAGTSPQVKALLCRAEQADVAMAPAADMFEIGARVQVLKRGTLFPLRAEKLYQAYRRYDRFDALPSDLSEEIQTRFLKTDFDTAWAATRSFLVSRKMTADIDKARTDPRHRMALVFRSYLGQSARWAIDGDPDRTMDYQIWCGPAMGAFNQWAKGSDLAAPENRKTPLLALNLLFGACVLTRRRCLEIQGIPVPSDTIPPLTLEKIRHYSR